MDQSSVGHNPASDKWAFDSETTQVFDDMLARSIPEFGVMRTAVTDLACHYAKDGTFIVDLGTSTGGALEGIIRERGIGNRYVGYECSKPMLEAARARFDGLIKTGHVQIEDVDLRKPFRQYHSSVVLSVLTLQFVPIEYRQSVVQRAYDMLAPGGAFIVVEKVLGRSFELDQFMVANYYKLKADHGYSQDSISRKRASLEGVLVPVTAAWNEDLLRTAGFRQVDCFWRWMNFAGWVAVK